MPRNVLTYDTSAAADHAAAARSSRAYVRRCNALSRKEAKLRAERAEERAWQTRLVALYADISEPERDAGRAWYPRALEIAHALSESTSGTLSPETCAAILAALSPRNRWAQNIGDAATLVRWFTDPESPEPELRDLGLYALRAQALKACEIARGADPLEILRGPKERRFYLNIIGDLEPVTVDVHATIGATDGFYSHPGSARRYERLERAYQRAARACGESPRDFQAIIWARVSGYGTTLEPVPGQAPAPEPAGVPF